MVHSCYRVLRREAHSRAAPQSQTGRTLRCKVKEFGHRFPHKRNGGGFSLVNEIRKFFKDVSRVGLLEKSTDAESDR